MERVKRVGRPFSLLLAEKKLDRNPPRNPDGPNGAAARRGLPFCQSALQRVAFHWPFICVHVPHFLVCNVSCVQCCMHAALVIPPTMSPRRLTRVLHVIISLITPPSPDG